PSRFITPSPPTSPLLPYTTLFRSCAEGYSSSIDMATALHPQTQLTFKYDGEVLPPKYGFPMRVRIPTKLGFKNPKHVIGMRTRIDRKSTRLNSSHQIISYAVFCLK